MRTAVTTSAPAVTIIDAQSMGQIVKLVVEKVSPKVTVAGNGDADTPPKR